MILADVADDRAEVPHRFFDIAGTRLALGADHGRPLGDAPQSFAEIGRPAHEGHGERPLVDVVSLVGGGQDLALVDVVDAEGFEHLGFDEVADARLGHHRDGHRRLDPLDQGGIAHAGHPTVAPDVGGNPLEGHDGYGAGVLGDLGLLRRDDVHDHATAKHLGQASLDEVGSCAPGGIGCGHKPSLRCLSALLRGCRLVRGFFTSRKPRLRRHGYGRTVGVVPTGTSSTHVLPGVSRTGAPEESGTGPPRSAMSGARSL